VTAATTGVDRRRGRDGLVAVGERGAVVRFGDVGGRIVEPWLVPRGPGGRDVAGDGVLGERRDGELETEPWPVELRDVVDLAGRNKFVLGVGVGPTAAVAEPEPRRPFGELRGRRSEVGERPHSQFVGDEVGPFDRREPLVIVQRGAVEFGDQVREPRPLVPREAVRDRDVGDVFEPLDGAVGDVGHRSPGGQPPELIFDIVDRQRARVRSQFREDSRRPARVRIEELVVRDACGVRAGDVQLRLSRLRVDEDVEHLPVVPVEVRCELVESEVVPELDDSQRGVDVFDPVVEHGRGRRSAASVSPTGVPLERGEAVDYRLAVPLGHVRARIGREPLFVFVEVKLRREPLREVARTLLAQLSSLPVRIAVERRTARRGRSARDRTDRRQDLSAAQAERFPVGHSTCLPERRRSVARGASGLRPDEPSTRSVRDPQPSERFQGR
jgi:hypothetical protein